MFIITGWVLLRARRRHWGNWWVVIAGFCLFGISTTASALCLCCTHTRTHAAQIFSLNIYSLHQGLITVGPFLKGGSDAYFRDIGRLPFVIKSTLYNVQTLILDAVVVRLSLSSFESQSLCQCTLKQIHRAYVAWQKWYMVAVPVLGWCGLLSESPWHYKT